MSSLINYFHICLKGIFFSKLNRIVVSTLLFGLSAGEATATNTSTGSIQVPGGGTLSYTVSTTIINNPTCAGDIPSYLSISFTSFSYSTAEITNPTVISNVKGVAGCSGDQISTPATLTLNNLCSLIFKPAYYGAPSATTSCPNFSTYPKYIVLGVSYAPPGPTSFVQYSQSNSLSTTLTDKSSYSSGTTYSTSLKAGYKTGISESTGTGTYAYGASQTTDSSSATTLSTSTTTGYKLMGPPSPPCITGGSCPATINTPIDHDYDVIWLWLNPVAWYTVSPGSMQFNGFAYDTSDIPEMDIYPIPVGVLRGSIPMTQSLANELARAWAAGNNRIFPAGDGPGLTSADYANILAANPFTATSYSVNPALTTSSDLRFTLAGLTPTNNSSPVQTFIYAPGTLTQNYQNTYVNSTAVSNGVTYTTNVTFSIDKSVSATYAGINSTNTLKVANQQTWTTGQNKSISNITTVVDTLSLGSPCVSCIYTGPTVFEVYQDNIYGTFMFNPVR